MPYTWSIETQAYYKGGSISNTQEYWAFVVSEIELFNREVRDAVE